MRGSIPINTSPGLNDNSFSHAKNITKIQLSAVSAVAATIPVKINHPAVSEPLIKSIPETTKSKKHLKFDMIYDHSLVAFSLLILAIALVSRPIVDKYLYSLPVQTPLHISKISSLGLNEAVPKANLSTWLNNFISQPASINLGTRTVAISPSTLKSWLNIEAGVNKNVYNIHLNTTLVKSSLSTLPNQYTTAPINQVVATRSDGTSETAVSGQDGTKLSDPSSLASQASNISKNLFTNKGFQLNAPLVSLPFTSTTPSSFNKLILVDVNSKKMYVYQNGQIVNTFLVSAGAPDTPTPIGEFHIYEKLPLQTMTGFNVNGTPYTQPNVEWVNYFDGSDAVHGVYWHPLSWFGVHNSSHGCVGIPDNEAEWVYNWAPIGTTVITTPN